MSAMIRENDSPTRTTVAWGMLALMAVVLGAAVAVVALPMWAPTLAETLVGDTPKGYWYLSRGAALVAYTLLWLSVALGLSMTSKVARAWPGGPTVFELHQFTSLWALVYAVFHAIILLGDRYMAYTPLQLALPFGSVNYETFAVGLGQVALYIMLPVTFTFYVRQRIGQRVWRLVHYASFAVYFLATAHGLQAGTDSRAAPVVALYVLSATTIFFLTTYRVLMIFARRGARPLKRDGQISDDSASG
ncbi:MAG: ferric reductase-like transmembrane domain-containing protein [Anaerolineae bacterium]